MTAWQGPWYSSPRSTAIEDYGELKFIEHLAWTTWHTNSYKALVLRMGPIDPISLFLSITQRKRENKQKASIKRALTDQRQGNAGSPLPHCSAIGLERKNTNEGDEGWKPAVTTQRTLCTTT